jgi:hypothetical protein
MPTDAERRVEECEACKRIVDYDRLLQTPLGYYICRDFEECIAAYSGWTSPPEFQKESE